METEAAGLLRCGFTCQKGQHGNEITPLHGAGSGVQSNVDQTSIRNVCRTDRVRPEADLHTKNGSVSILDYENRYDFLLSFFFRKEKHTKWERVQTALWQCCDWKSFVNDPNSSANILSRNQISPLSLAMCVFECWKPSFLTSFRKWRHVSRSVWDEVTSSRWSSSALPSSLFVAAVTTS